MIKIEFIDSFANKYKKGDKAEYSRDNARILVKDLKIAKYVSEAKEEKKEVKKAKTKE